MARKNVLLAAFFAAPMLAAVWGVLAMSALEAACSGGDRRACDSLGAQPSDFHDPAADYDGAAVEADGERQLTRDEHVRQKGSKTYLEDGSRKDYDPETCLVFSEAFAVVRSPECVAEKLQDYFAEDGGPSTFFYAERAFCSD